MKSRLRWLALVAAFIALIAGSLGCATMLAVSAATNHSDFYNTPVLSDAIIAIGRPDPGLAKEIGRPSAVAFIGEKNTYLVSKGGDELDGIAHLKLDWKHLDINSTPVNNRLYLKDKQFWGELELVYGDGNPLSADEAAELARAGFSQLPGCKCPRYHKTIAVEGLVYPPMQLSDNQMSRLGMRRVLNLYNPRDAKPPIKVGAALLVPVAVVADIVLTPVYLGVGVVILVGSAFSH